MRIIIVLFLTISSACDLAADQDVCRKKGMNACVDAFVEDASCFPVIKKNCFKCEDNKTPRGWRRAYRKWEKRNEHYRFIVKDDIGLLSQIEGDVFSFYYKLASKDPKSQDFFYQQSKFRNFDPLAIEDAKELKTNKYSPTKNKEYLDNIPVTEVRIIYGNTGPLSSRLFCLGLVGHVPFDPKYIDDNNSGNLSKKADNFSTNWPKDKRGRLVYYDEEYYSDGFDISCFASSSDNYKWGKTENLYAFCMKNPQKCENKKMALEQYYQGYLDYLEVSNSTPCLCIEGLREGMSKQCLDEVRKKNQDGSITCYIEADDNNKQAPAKVLITVDDVLKFKNTGEKVGAESAKKWWLSLPDNIRKFISEDKHYDTFKFMQALYYHNENTYKDAKAYSGTINNNTPDVCFAPTSKKSEQLDAVEQDEKKMLEIFGLK